MSEQQQNQPSEIQRKTLTEVETSRYVGMSRPWLRLRRMKKKPPTYIRQGRSIRYLIDDLDRWLSANRVECK